MKFKRSAFGYKSTDVEDYIDELAERHEVELEHKDIEIRRLKSSLEQLQQRAEEFETTSTRVRDLEGENSELCTRLAEAEQDGSQAQAEFASMRADLAAMDTLLREKGTAVQELQSEIAGLRNQVSDVPRLEAMLAEKDRLLNQIKAEAENTHDVFQSIEDLRVALEDKENVVEELNGRIASLEEALARQADELTVFQAAPTADTAAGVLVSDGQPQGSGSMDDISSYLSEVALDLGQAALQQNPAEFRRFRAVALALREHLSSLNSELSAYRLQEKAIAQALIHAQLKAAEIETDALSETIMKKAELIEELESGKVELELTKKTTQKFKDDLASVLENYKKRLINFGAADSLTTLPIDVAEED